MQDPRTHEQKEADDRNRKEAQYVKAVQQEKRRRDKEAKFAERYGGKATKVVKTEAECVAELEKQVHDLKEAYSKLWKLYVEDGPIGKPTSYGISPLQDAVEAMEFRERVETDLLKKLGVDILKTTAAAITLNALSY